VKMNLAPFLRKEWCSYYLEELRRDFIFKLI
jgi:hypothetical protein